MRSSLSQQLVVCAVVVLTARRDTHPPCMFNLTKILSNDQSFIAFVYEPLVKSFYYRLNFFQLTTSSFALLQIHDIDYMLSHTLLCSRHKIQKNTVGKKNFFSHTLLACQQVVITISDFLPFLRHHHTALTSCDNQHLLCR